MLPRWSSVNTTVTLMPCSHHPPLPCLPPHTVIFHPTRCSRSATSSSVACCNLHCRSVRSSCVPSITLCWMISCVSSLRISPRSIVIISPGSCPRMIFPTARKLPFLSRLCVVFFLPLAALQSICRYMPAVTYTYSDVFWEPPAIPLLLVLVLFASLAAVPSHCSPLCCQPTCCLPLCFCSLTVTTVANIVITHECRWTDCITESSVQRLGARMVIVFRIFPSHLFISTVYKRLVFLSRCCLPCPFVLLGRVPCVPWSDVLLSAVQCVLQ